MGGGGICNTRIAQTLVSSHYKEHFKINKEKNNDSREKWVKVIGSWFIEKASTHMKRCLLLYIKTNVKQFWNTVFIVWQRFLNFVMKLVKLWGNSLILFYINFL